MKLRYTFEMMELDDYCVAVPVGKSAEEFKGVLKMNSSAKEIIELLVNDVTIDEVCELLNCKYPDQNSTIKEYVECVISKLRDGNFLEE